MGSEGAGKCPSYEVRKRHRKWWGAGTLFGREVVLGMGIRESSSKYSGSLETTTKVYLRSNTCYCSLGNEFRIRLKKED